MTWRCGRWLRHVCADLSDAYDKSDQTHSPGQYRGPRHCRSGTLRQAADSARRRLQDGERSANTTHMKVPAAVGRVLLVGVLSAPACVSHAGQA
jgi:hypothetical protein